MKKIMAFVLAAIMVLSFSACGCDKKATIDAELIGEWYAINCEVAGEVLTGEDVAGFNIVINDDGTATLTFDTTTYDATWTLEEDLLTFTYEDKELTATLCRNLLTFTETEDGKTEHELILMFENMAGKNATVYLAHEGSTFEMPVEQIEAADAKMVGEWKSVSAVNEDGSEAGVNADALLIKFNEDYTVNVVYKGENLGANTWSAYEGFGCTDGDEEIAYSFAWDYTDGGIDVTFSYNDKSEDGEAVIDYYVFSCVKTDDEAFEEEPVEEATEVVTE